MRTLTIPGHHNGPDGVGQGGMLAGHLARLSGLPLDVPFEVTLRAPAPLDTPLRVDARPEGGSSLWLQDTLVAEARPATAPPTAPPAVALEVAEGVAGGLAHANPFPRCFVCGHELQRLVLWGAWARQSASPGMAISLLRSNAQMDVRHLLPSVQVPTLALHHTGDVLVDVGQGRYLADHIPNARLHELPGRHHWPWIGPDADFVADEAGGDS